LCPSVKLISLAHLHVRPYPFLRIYFGQKKRPVRGDKLIFRRNVILLFPVTKRRYQI
jgi:hypothetical protein